MTVLSFFEQKANRVKRSRIDTSGVFQKRNGAFVEAFFHASLRIAKAEMLPTNAEELILPCAIDINCILSGKEAESKLNILSIWIKTVQHWVSLMSEHIKDQVIDRVKSVGPFALRKDESKDVLRTAFYTRALHLQW